MRRVSLSWMLLYAAGRMGVGMHDIFFNFLAAFYLNGYGLPNVVQGFLANERSLIGSPLQPVFGAISDRLRTPIGRRRPLMLLMAPVVLGFLVLIFQPNVWIVVAIFLLGPIFVGLSVTAYEVLLPDCVVPEQRGTVNGLSRLLGFATGIGLLLVASALWESQQGVVFVLVAVGLAIGFAITGLTIREPAPELDPPLAPEVNSTFPEYLRELVSHREATKYVVCYFFFWFGLGGITPFITRFGNAELGIPENETFVLGIVALAATAIFVVPAGWLGDRVDKKLITLLGLSAFGMLVLLGSQLQTREQAILVLGLAGVAQAAPTALAYPLFTELVPGRRMGELSGMSTMVWSFAQPLGATLLGGLADLTGTLRSVLMGGAISMLIAAAILQTIKVREATLAAEWE